MRAPSIQSTVPDIVSLLQEWSDSLPTEYAHRWQVTPVYHSLYRAKVWQLVRVDTTAADVSVVLPPPSAGNVGAQIAVHVIRGANQAMVMDDLSTAFGKRSSPISLDYSGLFISVGTHWELLAGGA